MRSSRWPSAPWVGWGLVIDTTQAGKHLGWLGYFLDGFTVDVGGFQRTWFDLGGTDGAWAYANLGVPVALGIGFVGYLVFGFCRRTPAGARRAAGPSARRGALREPCGR